ncbi:MAG: DHH family phosphoesterase [Pirellulales bacterium]|nr:DHH family phosphoesterase [Pirellulales bacterium]
MIDWSPLVEIVRCRQRFLLTTHIRPDADALGSELALGRALEHLGKDVLLCNAFAVPPNLKFLDPQEKSKQLGKDVGEAEIGRCEVLVVLDTSAWAQLGEMAEVIRRFPGRKAVVDHHVSQDDLGAETYKDEEIEATGRLVMELIDALGVALTPEIAGAVFAAVATDTGWFRFSSTQPETFRLAARLVEAGARPDALYKDFYENDSPGRLRLIGRALGRTETELGGRLIHTYLDRHDFNSTKALPSDSEDIINLTLSVGGTEAAVILVEQPTGGFKVSFRSRCDLDCAALAERFGGGGHKKAAGAFLPGELAAVQSRVLDAVRAALQ